MWHLLEGRYLLEGGAHSDMSVNDAVLIWNLSLHCLKSVQIGVFSGPYLDISRSAY